MKVSSAEHTLMVLFMELMCLTPLFIILGNIVPPAPIKIHFIALGVIFCIAIGILALHPKKKWVLYLILGVGLLQFLMPYPSIKNTIDLMFGPVVLFILLDILFNQRLEKQALERYKRKFYNYLWIPVLIGVLQAFDIMPVTFWNADYINWAYFDDYKLPRPNGFLYHGSELSIIIFFLALAQFFRKGSGSFWMLLVFVVIAKLTLYKALFASVIVLFLYYLFLVNPTIKTMKLLSRKQLIAYVSVVAVASIGVLVVFFQSVHQQTGYYFPPQLLTGRGSIWNIYSDAINEYSIWNYLFGTGMGSGQELFKAYASPDNYYLLRVSPILKEAYDAHNALLSLFVNMGLAGIAFFAWGFRIIYQKVKTWKSDLNNGKLFFALAVIPVFTIGITIPIFDMAIYWPCVGFLIYQWYFYSEENTVDAE
ncbi:MAG: O-antigen ligase family protein [Crocinitomicaceae bacterium]